MTPLAGEIDLGDTIREITASTTQGGMLGSWYDRALFARVRLEAGTTVWPNGADLRPDVL